MAETTPGGVYKLPDGSLVDAHGRPVAPPAPQPAPKDEAPRPARGTRRPKE